MEKKLPSVFVNSNANNINGNNKKIYYSFYNNKNLDKKYNGIDIRRKINSLFSNSNSYYKVKTKITYINGEEREEVIVFRNYDYLLNIEGKRIFIDDILDIN